MNLGIAQYDNYSREMFEFEYDVSVRSKQNRLKEIQKKCYVNV